MPKKQHIKVEYIESGTFVGGEEDAYDAGIKRGEVCHVITKKGLASLLKARDSAQKNVGVLAGTLLFVIKGLRQGTIKAKPIIDMSNKEVTSFPIRSLEEEIWAALGKCGISEQKEPAPEKVKKGALAK